MGVRDGGTVTLQAEMTSNATALRAHIGTFGITGREVLYFLEKAKPIGHCAICIHLHMLYCVF